MKTTDLKTLDLSSLSATSGGHHHHHHHGGHRHGYYGRWYDRPQYVMASAAPTIIIAR